MSDAPPSGRDQRLYDLRLSIAEVSPREAYALRREGAALIDVREPDEIALGSPEGAVRIGRGYLELQVEEIVRDRSQPVLVLCGHGTRSLFAADDLLRLGYEDVRSVAGGYHRWRLDGLPVEVPDLDRLLAGDPVWRRARAPALGEAERRRRREARVLVVGAGGLGTAAAMSLAAAGVGTIGLVDDRPAERADLRRAMLEALHPAAQIVEHPAPLASENVEEAFAGYDLVLDGTEDLPTRYLVHDACLKLKLAGVHGSVRAGEGLVSVFWPGRAAERGPCYRCLDPAPPPPAPSEGSEGVGGVLPGVVGTLGAVEAVKLLLGVGDPLVARLLHLDALTMRIAESALSANPLCTHCGRGASFPGYADYQKFCGARVPAEGPADP
ncbi:MAG: ThiF family adenylyltransferase [Planctomycetota bacterium]